MVFFARTEPAQSIAKPSCMAKTKYVEKRRQVVSSAKPVSTNLLETASKRPQMNSAAAEAFAAGPRRGRRSAAEQERVEAIGIWGVPLRRNKLGQLVGGGDLYFIGKQSFKILTWWDLIKQGTRFQVALDWPLYPFVVRRIYGPHSWKIVHCRVSKYIYFSQYWKF